MYFSKSNSFYAEGRLTHEPNTNYSDKGNLVTSVRLAVKTPFVKDGKNEVAYITYTAIDSENNKIATNLAEFVTTGSPIYLEGYLDSYSVYDKQDPEKVIYNEIKRIVRFESLENKAETEKRKERNAQKK